MWATRLGLIVAATLCVVAASGCTARGLTSRSPPHRGHALAPCGGPGEKCRSVNECLRLLQRAPATRDACSARVDEISRASGPDAIPKLIPWLDSGPVGGVARRALLRFGAQGVAYLRHAHYARSWRGLVEFVDWGPDSGAAARALKARALDDVPGVVAALDDRGYLSYTNPALTVARVVGATQPEWVAPLTRALWRGRATDWRMARNSATALGFLGRREALPALLDSLESSDWRLVLASLEAVVRIGCLTPAQRKYVAWLARSHWSSQVRAEAHDAVALLADGCAPAASQGLPRMLDHQPLSELLAHHGGDRWPLPVLHPGGPRRTGPFSFPSRGHFPVFATWHGPLRCRENRTSRQPFVTVVYDGEVFRLKRLVDQVPGSDRLHPAAACGGLIEGQGTVIARGCFGAVRQLGGRWVALWSDRDGTSGRIDSVVLQGGKRVVRPFIELPAAPHWLGAAEDGTLLVGTDSGDVAVDATGHVESLGCPTRGHPDSGHPVPGR